MSKRKEVVNELEKANERRGLEQNELCDLFNIISAQANQLDAAINVIESLHENFLTPPVKEQLDALLRILIHEEY